MGYNKEEARTCPICGAEQLSSVGMVSSVYSNRRHELLRCRICGHKYDYELFTQEEIDVKYKTVYNYQSHSAIASEKKWRIKQTFATLINDIKNDFTIVDIGCMYGFSLEALRELGAKHLFGIEIETTAVTECRAKGFNVFEGNLAQWFLSSKKIVSETNNLCFLMSHVIEHIDDVEMILRDLRTKMKPGEFLLILVPNSDAYTTRICGKNWGWWQVPIHRHHFTSASLQILLKRCGFDNITISTRGADTLFWFSSIASLLGMKSASSALSFPKRKMICAISAILRFWFFIGNEEILCIART